MTGARRRALPDGSSALSPVAPKNLPTPPARLLPEPVPPAPSPAGAPPAPAEEPDGAGVAATPQAPGLAPVQPLEPPEQVIRVQYNTKLRMDTVEWLRDVVKITEVPGNNIIEVALATYLNAAGYTREYTRRIARRSRLR